jgi:TonB dependent receptor/TonB-dependent Receptor Plug Domain
MVVTQHSGDGKANQYFLRGFNLDHGTDFATYIDGMPVNMPSHAHGQGYTDLNFLMPELIERIDFRKGPYYAENGDFSSAGSARISLKNKFENNFGEITLGNNHYQRLVTAGTTPLDNGANLLLAFEEMRNDGPWQVGEDLKKTNAIFRLSQTDGRDRFSITAMAYQNSWKATDQIPQAYIDSGVLDRFGTMNASDGGNTSRYSLSGNWRHSLDDGYIEASLYAIRYKLQLYSDFTYFLNDPSNGDQILQSDDRNIFGGVVKRLWGGSLFDQEMTNEFGIQVRQDRIQVGLANTMNRQITSIVRDDAVLQSSAGLYAENIIRWQPWLRTNIGGRLDQYNFNVNSNLVANSGNTSATMFSPKFSLILGPFNQTEYFVNWGQGFHSNDARGTTITVDPTNTSNTVSAVPGLVKTSGYELGLRTEIIPQLQSSLAIWLLDIGSELVFTGDAGITEASRASRRYGIEWTNRYSPKSWLSFQVDLSLSRAQFTEYDIAGDNIPGSVQQVALVSANLMNLGPWSGNVQWRYIGARPLIEDGSVYSSPTSLVSTGIKYQINPKNSLRLDIFNLLNAKVDDISYYYQAQLTPSSLPFYGIFTHPSEPRTFRISWRISF